MFLTVLLDVPFKIIATQVNSTSGWSGFMSLLIER